MTDSFNDAAHAALEFDAAFQTVETPKIPMSDTHRDRLLEVYADSDMVNMSATEWLYRLVVYLVMTASKTGMVIPMDDFIKKTRTTKLEHNISGGEKIKLRVLPLEAMTGTGGNPTIQSLLTYDEHKELVATAIDQSWGLQRKSRFMQMMAESTLESVPEEFVETLSRIMGMSEESMRKQLDMYAIPIHKPRQATPRKPVKTSGRDRTAKVKRRVMTPEDVGDSV